MSSSIVVTSVEVDVFVLPGGGLHDPIEEQFGLDTPYHAAHGVYADPLGAGIVSLPPGWEERLVTLSAGDGSVTYQALEIHDTAVTKLMALVDITLQTNASHTPGQPLSPPAPHSSSPTAGGMPVYAIKH